MASLFEYSHALVRPISSEFVKALSMKPPEPPVDEKLASTQHDAYVDLLRSLVTSVIEVPPSSQHPDCCFIEDTMMFFRAMEGSSRTIAVISNPGAPTRQGEQQAVKQAIRELADLRPSLEIAEITKGTIDGGDVLFTGDAVFVGISHRTTQEAADNLQELLTDYGLQVFSIPVTAGLHLKSCCSLIATNVLVVADTEAGHNVKKLVGEANPAMSFLVVPDAVASNVLRIGSHIIIQDGFQESENILTAFAATQDLTVHKLNMSEFIKVDGALTCCNVLLYL